MVYTKYHILCHLLFQMMQCYNYLLYISFIINKGKKIGGLHIIEKSTSLSGKKVHQ